MSGEIHKLPIPTATEAHAELARRHLLDFIDFMWQRDDGFIRGRHTMAVGAALDRAHDRYVAGESTWLCIQVPYRHGKSEISSRYLPAWFTGHHPQAETMVVSYGTTLARVFSRYARQIMRDPRYGDVFPGVELAFGNRAVDQWSVVTPDGAEQGRTHWLGISAGATGKGANLLVVDDFFKNREEAESPVMREKVWDGLVNNILTRLAPVSIVVILATPWHIDDPFARIKQRMGDEELFPRFEFLRFPAFGKRAGRDYEYLFPERFSPEWYHAQESLLGKYATAGLLQCEPIARGGNILKVENIRFYDEMPENVPLVRGWDLASTQKQRDKQDPDFTAGARVGVEWLPTAVEGEQMPVIYIDDVVDGQWDAPQRDKIIRAVAHTDDKIPIGVESFGAYRDAAKLLQESMKGLRIVREVRLPGDKLSKANTLEVAMVAGNVFMRRAAWNDRVLKQFEVWPNGPHDDIVDAVTVAVALHAPHETRVWPMAGRLLSRRFKISWNNTDVDVRCMHYAGVWLSKELVVYTVAALWDAKTGRLMVYDSWQSEPEPSDVAQGMKARMHLAKYKVTAMYCNGDMNPDPPAVSMMRQVNAALNKINVSARLRQGVRYNEMGAIMKVRALMNEQNLLVHECAAEALGAWTTWTIAGGSASGDGDGYCRALCLIASEVVRVERSRPKTRRRSDYRVVVRGQA